MKEGPGVGVSCSVCLLPLLQRYRWCRRRLLYLQVQLLLSLRRRPGLWPSCTSCSRSTHEAPSAAKDLVILQSNAERRLPISVSHHEIPASVTPETQGWAAAQAMMMRKRMQRQSLSFAVIFLITFISGIVVCGPSTPLRRRGRWYLLYGRSILFLNICL